MANHVSRLTFDVSRIMILMVILLALVLRVHRLGAQSLWYDEAVTAHVAAQGIAELTRWTADDIQPPLYYYLVAGWTRLVGPAQGGNNGRGEWVLRFPSAFFSTLAVPLLWALARRLFGPGRRGEVAGLSAALLAAVSPLYVYYGQEARMYAQLTFLAALAGYALLRATTDEGRPLTDDRRRTTSVLGSSSFFLLPSSRQWWLAFVVASACALYTHYFAIFLLFAYGVCVAVDCLPRLLREGMRSRAARTLITFGAASLGIALLYLPWLPAMLTRYRVDRSYWQGALKLGEALRHVAVSFTSGAPDTMLEADAVRLLPWFGVAFGVAILAPVLHWRSRGAEGQRGGEGRWSLAYLSICLLVPLILILFLASRTPKFNARYLMMVSPAYLLILAGGVGALADGGRPTTDDGRHLHPPAGAVWTTEGGQAADFSVSRFAFHVSRITHYALRLVAAILLLFLVAGSVRSLSNWFTDPAFTKAQWRELVAAVRANIAPDEAVVLVSGHAWPAWDYYGSDMPRVRLPDIDILDVDAILGFDAGAVLGRELAGKAGAWLVRWQADAVDPVGFAPYFLDRAGRRAVAPGPFWHLELGHWRLAEDATFPTAPQPAHTDAANFDHKLALLGWDDPVGGQITVYWRGINSLDRDYQVSLILEDAGGKEVGRWDGRPAGYDYPTARWQPGQALFGRYPLPIPASAPPGHYIVTLAVYDDADPAGLDIRDVADNPTGKRVRLGPMKLNAE